MRSLSNLHLIRSLFKELSGQSFKDEFKAQGVDDLSLSNQLYLEYKLTSKAIGLL